MIANRQRIRQLLSAVGLMGLGMLISPLLEANTHQQDGASRLFELRTYTTHEGRLPALDARFQNHTNKLFVKHGMAPIGYWTPTDKEQAANTLIYLLAYNSLEDREKSWQNFLADPDWQAAFAASRADGPIVSDVESIFLEPTAYSPLR